MKKSIAFVFDGMGFGGIERIGIDYVRMCVDAGYLVHVYNLNPSADSLAKTLPRAVVYHAYKMSRKGCPETYSFGIQKWWWGKYAYAVLSPLLSLKQVVEKCLFGHPEFDFAIAISGHINDLSFVAKKYIGAERKICWCHGSLLSYLSICDAYSILYRKVDAIVTLSSTGLKDVYGGKKFLYDKKITKIYNPTFILERKIDSKKVEELKKKYGKYILNIARFEFRKGQDTAVKVMKLLKERGVESRILFAGEGTTVEEIKHLAEREGLEENCIFLGSCHDIQNYIAGSHLNLLTSRWEGLPTVIIEAMSLGKPCVMTNTDDGEVSHNGEFCILKEIDDVEGIADGVEQLYRDSGLYQKYVELSLARAEAFRPDKIKEQFFSFMESL